MSFDHVLGTLTSGSMAAMAKDRSDCGAPRDCRPSSPARPRVAYAADAEGRCTQRPAAFCNRSTVRAGTDGASTPATAASSRPTWRGLTAEQVPRLRLKWAYAFPGASVSFAPPTIVGGLLFIGGTDRKVHALDARSGCTLWTLATDAAVRAAISFAPLSGSDQFAIFFGDLRANAYAVNALTGALIWKTKVEEHPAARITGAPMLHSGVLYVPVSSLEEAAGSQATYECCTFRGSVVALDAADRQAGLARPIRFPKRRSRPARMQGARSSTARPAPRSGRRRRSMRRATLSMSRPAIPIPIHRPQRAMRSSLSILRRESCSGSSRRRRRTRMSSRATPRTRPIALKITDPITISASRRSS